MTGSDAELRSRAEELAHLEQRFDIHVMAFADQSDATTQALQAAFSVDRATAQRMLAATPVVVKRAATPEVAGALLDALNKLGAQVVLLPSDTKASLRPPKPKPDAPPPANRAAAHAPSVPPPTAAAQVPAAAWGALDLQLAAPARRATPFDPSALEPAEPAAPARRDSAELEESLDGADDDEQMSTAGGEAGGELHLHSSAPPALQQRQRSAPSLPPRSAPSLPESEELGLDGLAAVEFEPSGPPPPPGPLSAAPRARQSPLPAGPSLAPARVAMRAPELGLGTVPPLPPRGRAEFVPLSPSAGPPPSLSMAPAVARAPRPPPPATAPRAPGPPPAQQQVQLPALGRPGEPRRAPRGRGDPTRDPRRNPTEPRLKTKAGSAKAAGATKRAGAKADPLPEAPVRQAFERDPFPSPALPSSRAEFPVPPQPGAGRAAEPSQIEPRRAEAPKPAAAPAPEPERTARGLALLMVIGSLLGLGLGVYVGDSVLQGGASLLSIALHGIALYGFGVGVAGLRP